MPHASYRSLPIKACLTSRPPFHQNILTMPSFFAMLIAKTFILALVALPISTLASPARWSPEPSPTPLPDYASSFLLYQANDSVDNAIQNAYGKAINAAHKATLQNMHQSSNLHVQNSYEGERSERSIRSRFKGKQWTGDHLRGSSSHH